MSYDEGLPEFVSITGEHQYRKPWKEPGRISAIQKLTLQVPELQRKCAEYPWARVVIVAGIYSFGDSTWDNAINREALLRGWAWIAFIASSTCFLNRIFRKAETQTKIFRVLNIGNSVAPGSIGIYRCDKQVNIMNLDRLFQVLSAIHPLSESFRAALEKEMARLSLPRYHFLLEAPEVAGHAYFLETGFAISYTFIKGKRQVENFWSSGHIVVSAKSFFEQVPAAEYIQLMEQSDVLFISYPGVLRLFDSFPEANFIYRVTMNEYYEHSRERIRDMQHMNAVERYKKLRDGFPRIEQIISQEDIASYLGITPQSLSRLKKLTG